MRELKFRAFKKKQMTMFYPKSTIDILGLPQVMLNKEDDILMQYTGLTDKNGTEIYEGDVLKSETNHYYECIFSDGCFKLKHDFFGVFLPEKWNNIEIIGNLYENPSLLEIKENNSEVKK